MEVERRTPDQVGKKVWSLLRAVFFMMRKGLLKGKFVLDLHVLLKRGKLAGKAIGNLMLHHYSAVSCRSDDTHLSFVSPREYEFSCSNSPAVDYAYTYFHRRNNKHGGFGFGDYHTHGKRGSSRLPKPVDVATLAAVQRVLEMLNNESAVEASPYIGLPGFGKSPVVRQLRITDSPFPLKDDGDSRQVDVAAEEFIKNFYKDLKSQKSPNNYHYDYDAWRG